MISVLPRAIAEGVKRLNIRRLKTTIDSIFFIFLGYDIRD